MRAFKKALMAFAAVTAVSAAFAATSFAADLKVDYAAGKVAITAGMDAIQGQMTVLLIPKGAEEDEDGITEGDILYINQAAANTANLEKKNEEDLDVNATFGYMGVKGGELKDGWYTLMVGSDAKTFTDENKTEFKLMTVDFEVKSTPAGREIQLGDCDGIAGLDIGDSSAILQHIAGVALLTGDNLIAADCDGITGLDIGDSSAVLQHIAGVALLDKIVINN